MNGAPGIPRLGLPAYDYWNEASARRRQQRRCPPPFSRNQSAERRPGIRNCSTRKEPSSALKAARSFNDYATQHNGDSKMVERPDLLDAEHQHFPRPALGPRPGNLRRRPLPHQRDWHRVRQRHSGRRSQLHAGDGLRQTLRGPQRAGIGCGIVLTPNRRIAICMKPICRNSSAWCAKATSPASWALTTPSIGVPCCASTLPAHRPVAQAMGI